MSVMTAVTLDMGEANHVGRGSGRRDELGADVAFAEELLVELLVHAAMCPVLPAANGKDARAIASNSALEALEPPE